MSRSKRGRPVHGILLFDKPLGCSSNQALQRIKRLYNAQKAGHTGSLDPLATGMLPLCFGEATKVCGYLLNADKEYVTTARFGVTTNTGDAEGEVTSETQVPENLDVPLLQRTAEQLTGPIDQIPPMYSALKIDGQRLYKLAREGIEVERQARRVHIFSIDVLALSADSAQLKVRCSKGTYIRTLVEDIGKLLGCGAHVATLRRLSVNPFHEEAMLTQAQLELLAGASTGVSAKVAEQPSDERDYTALDQLLLPPELALQHLHRIDLLDSQGIRFKQGQSVTLPSADAPAGSGDLSEPGLGEILSDTALCRVHCEGNFLGVADLVGQTVKPRRLFNL